MAPQDPDCADLACTAAAAVTATLLRRLLGQGSAAEALAATLQPLDLHRDITFATPDNDARMAWVVRKPVEGLSLPRIFEFLETQKRKAELGGPDARDRPQWLSWSELEDFCPPCTDALLPNRKELRSGEECAPGRGLRASAKAMCRLLRWAARGSADAKASEGGCGPLLATSLAVRDRQLKVLSLNEYEKHGRCLDSAIGWQLFRFRNLARSGGDVVVGYGHVDGATGSVCMRLPGVSLAILLNGVNPVDAEDLERPGFELLCVAARQLNLEPLWPGKAPAVPAKTPVRHADSSQEDTVKATLERLDRNVQQLAQEIKNFVPSDEGKSAAAAGPLCGGGPQSALFVGRWVSVEVEGLEALLERFEVPSAFHFLAKRASRELQIERAGPDVCIAASTALGGRTIDENKMTLSVGKSFDGQQQLGGSFRGMARWARVGSGLAAGQEALVLEKRFSVQGQEVVLEETYVLLDGGDRLQIRAMCTGPPEPGKPLAEPIACTMTYERQGGRPLLPGDAAHGRLGGALVQSEATGGGRGTLSQISDILAAALAALPLCMPSCRPTAASGGASHEIAVPRKTMDA